MTSDDQGFLISILRPEIAAMAVDLTEIAGSAEYCFPICVAKHVLDVAIANETVPLGGDVWELVGGDYIATGDNWYTDPIENESRREYVTRTRLTAYNFLERYERDRNKWATFVI